MNDSYLLPIFLKALEDAQAPEEVIENYKKLFLASTGEWLPCPVCFFLHNQRSRLRPLPGDDKSSPVKCLVCGKEFIVRR